MFEKMGTVQLWQFATVSLAVSVNVGCGKDYGVELYSVTGTITIDTAIAADRSRMGQMLRQLVRDIAGVKVWKNQYVGAAGHLAIVFHFLPGNGGCQCRIGLELSIDQQFGVS